MGLARLQWYVALPCINRHHVCLQAYLAVHERVMCLLEQITDDGSGQPWKVYLTGKALV